MPYMISNIHTDEVRCKYIVTASRKKIWEKELEMLEIIDKICHKYHIKYFADYGTLLGCIRHGGFIPWDDDIDIAMLRPDYEKFCNVARKEVKMPFFIQNIYTDNRINCWTKFMNDDTSAIEFWDNFDIHQGLFIDIFPLDFISDGSERFNRIELISKELWACIMAPNEIGKRIFNNECTVLNASILQRFLNMDYRDCMKEYEQFCLNHFSEATLVGTQSLFWCGDKRIASIDDYSEIIYKDFEGFNMPVPVGYKDILKASYGDEWRTPKQVPNDHDGCVMSADIPYKIMLEKIDRKLLTSSEYIWL